MAKEYNVNWEYITDMPNSEVLMRYSMMADDAITRDIMNDIEKSRQKSNG